MGMTAGELEVVLSAKDQVSGVVRDVDASAGGLGSKLRGIAPIAAMGFAAVAAGAVVVGKAVLDMGDQFDSAYDGIRIGTGATGKTLEGLKDDFRAVVKDVPTDFATASSAITELNRRLGVTGKPLQDLSKQFLELSRITGTDVAENVRLGTRLFGDWSVAAKDQAGAMDLVFRASQKSGIGISDLMSTVVQFGAPLRNMGFDLGESVAMLAKWEREGVNTSTVLTGMKFALKTFAAAGLEPKKALEEIIPKIHDMTNAQAAMTLGMQTFGLRAGPDMVAAIREGRFAYTDFQKAIEGGKDTITAAAADTADWGEKFQILKNRAFVGLEPVIMGVFNAVGKLFDIISQAASAPQVAALGTVARAQFRIMGEVIGAVLPVVRSLWDALVKGAQSIATYIGPSLQSLWQSMQPALAAAKEVVVAFALDVQVAVDAIVDFIRSHWDTIGPILKAAWDAGITYTKAFFAVLAPILRAIADLLKGDWSAAWEHAKEVVRVAVENMGKIGESLEKLLKLAAEAAMRALVAALKAGAREAVEFVASIPERIAEGLAALAGLLTDAGRAGMRGLWNGLKDAWGDVSGWVKSVPGKIKDFFAGAGGWLLSAGSAIMGGLLDGIISAWQSVANYLSSLGGKIKGLKGPIDKDRQLLVPEGLAIMEGLNLGLQQGSQRVLAMMAGLGGRMTLGAPGGAAPAYAGGPAAGGYGQPIVQNFYVTNTVNALEPDERVIARLGQRLQPVMARAGREMARKVPR